MTVKTKLAIVSMSVEKRKTIAVEHAKRHGGIYRPAVFMEEASDKLHPAHKWFEWDDAKAGYKWRLARARQFVSGIRIISELVLNEHDPITIKSSPVPEPVQKPFMVSDYEGSYVTEGFEVLRSARHERSSHVLTAMAESLWCCLERIWRRWGCEVCRASGRGVGTKNQSRVV